MENKNFALILLISAFTGSLVISQVLASKIVLLGGLVVPAGVLAYSITFVATDVISEIWGKDVAKRVVWGGFISVLISLLLIKGALLLPAASFWPHEQAFNTILSSTPRIILASFIAYLVSQAHDVWAFHFWKDRFQGRHLWFRNNLSTIVSQVIDTVLFIGIAFYGSMPILPIIAGQLIIKWGIALLDTPLVYLLVKVCSSFKEVESC
ncbi:MAG: queuosine precursor transporter [Desulfonauticus sp.]|nr:queuosine precursor transporter [Desulfonauticus sp.]